MANKNVTYFSFTIPFYVFLFLFPYVQTFPVQARSPLDYRFYEQSCPRLPMIVQYHGCDASVLLDDTEDFEGEKSALPNLNSLRGYDVIDNIKADVEKYCIPQTVSCVDILTLASREAVGLSGGPFWPVLLGRRDGTTANKQSVLQQIPFPSESLKAITAKFTAKGLDLKDVVALSGGHTIGFAQCFTFKGRLFNYKGTGNPDPELDTSVLTSLQTMCPNTKSSNTKLAPLDSESSNRFDNSYFGNVMNKAGLLESDQALLDDPRAAALVSSYSENPYLFSMDFAASMVKLGNLGILTGQDGEIRQKCGSVNH
ncbi:hypothetical protein TIFTF001_006898 [Ficus carica]|uniref:Peroxidase n=1 Tax=Ficus carica TaxID=3494 RepID=A0AA87ZPY7_FICCA|nr:hypothetical protein TIFTF001_006898 [Ficus carica]